MIDTIRKDLKEAMKAGDKLKLTALRNLVAKIKAKEIDNGATLDKNEAIKVCMSAAKQIKESIRQFKEAGRDDLVETEALELQIIETYLPKQISNRTNRIHTHILCISYAGTLHSSWASFHS